jgi:hypothetical protein
MAVMTIMMVTRFSCGRKGGHRQRDGQDGKKRLHTLEFLSTVFDVEGRAGFKLGSNFRAQGLCEDGAASLSTLPSATPP